jgi:hypothetical protein
MTNRHDGSHDVTINIANGSGILERNADERSKDIKARSRTTKSLRDTIAVRSVLTRFRHRRVGLAFARPQALFCQVDWQIDAPLISGGLEKPARGDAATLIAAPLVARFRWTPR